MASGPPGPRLSTSAPRGEPKREHGPRIGPSSAGESALERCPSPRCHRGGRLAGPLRRSALEEALAEGLEREVDALSSTRELS